MRYIGTSRTVTPVLTKAQLRALGEAAVLIHTQVDGGTITKVTKRPKGMHRPTRHDWYAATRSTTKVNNWQELRATRLVPSQKDHQRFIP